jgi:hypothetical protein
MSRPALSRLGRLLARRTPAPTRRLLAQVISYMARSGIGTDECLEAGSLPLPVHFYSPVPDLRDLDDRAVWQRRSELAGVDLRPDAQVELLRALGREFGHECEWSVAAVPDEHAFHLDNPSFSFACAASTHAMLRHHRPRRVIEVGSGMSSRVISAALRRNEADGHPPADYTIVDPYPAASTRTLPGLTRLIDQRVELLPTARFEELQADDVLFVDSGHAVRIGGDVNFLILDVLPRLAPGVVVHFHDIPLPFEYSRSYYTNPSFRVLWTESYLLQAFLACNDRFEVRLALAWLMTEREQEFRAGFPAYARTPPRISGSFWLRRAPAAPG